LVKHEDISALIAVLTKAGYDFVKFENLYVYDGELGFSLS